MMLEELVSSYILCDGNVLHFQLCLNYPVEQDVLPSTACIEIEVRKKKDENKLERCILEIVFEGIVQVSIFEDFTMNTYSDLTFQQLENGLYYFSLDPFGNTNTPHPDDNFVLIAHSFLYKEKK